MGRGLVVTVLALDVAMACAGGWFMRQAAAEPLVVIVPAIPAIAERAPEVVAVKEPEKEPGSGSGAERKRRAGDTAAVVVAPPAPAPLVISTPDAAVAPVVVAPDAAPVAVLPPDAAVDPTPVAEPDEALTDSIRQKIESHREAVQQCYARAAKATTEEDPLAGRVEIHLTVLPEGDVSEVRVVKNETGSEALGACLVGLISSWRFPGPPHEAIDYVWPFIFSSRSSRSAEARP